MLVVLSTAFSAESQAYRTLKLISHHAKRLASKGVSDPETLNRKPRNPKLRVLKREPVRPKTPDQDPKPSKPHALGCLRQGVEFGSPQPQRGRVCFKCSIGFRREPEDNLGATPGAPMLLEWQRF